LVLEYLFTLDNEVKYIWGSKPFFAWTKLLFVIVRYVPLMTSFVRLYVVMNPVVDPSVCLNGIAFTAWSGILSSAAVEVILMLRVWALYSRNRAVLIFFSIVAVTGTVGALLILQVKPEPVPAFLAPVAPSQMTTCAHGNPVQHPLLFTLLACVEICIFSMLVKKAAFAVTGPRRAAPILTVLVKDGAMYFVFVFLSLILAGISPFIRYLAQPVMDSEFTVGFSAAACVRLIFSLRGAQLHDQEEEEEQLSRRPLASMAFSDPTRAGSRSLRRVEDGDEDDFLYEPSGRRTGSDSPLIAGSPPSVKRNVSGSPTPMERLASWIDAEDTGSLTRPSPIVRPTISRLSNRPDRPPRLPPPPRIVTHWNDLNV